MKVLLLLGLMLCHRHLLLCQVRNQNEVVIRVALGQNKVVDRLSLDVWSLHLCVDSNILGRIVVA